MEAFPIRLPWSIPMESRCRSCQLRQKHSNRRHSTHAVALETDSQDALCKAATLGKLCCQRYWRVLDSRSAVGLRETNVLFSSVSQLLPVSRLSKFFHRNDIAKQLPPVAFKAHQSKLLDRSKIRRRCINCDAGQQPALLEADQA